MGAIPDNMVSVRTVPWHKNATIVDLPLTAKEAMVLAQLDYPVSKVPVYTMAHDATGKAYPPVELENFKAIVRDDDGTCFQIATDAYNVVQNHESFAFFDGVIDGKTAGYQTAFSLKHGRIVCLSALLDREIRVGGVDTIQPYIVLANSFDSSLAFGMHMSPTRPVCENTLNLSLQTANASWKAKHTANLDVQIKEAQAALEFATLYYDAFEQEANQMIETELTKADFESIIRVAYPKKAKTSTAFSIQQYQMIGTFESSPTIPDEYRYTQWGALNAVGEFFDWSKERRTKGLDDTTAADARALDSLFGSAVKGRQSFYDAMVTA